MNVVFLGSGPFALPALEVLWRAAERHPLRCVVTRPDRPARRGRRPTPTPVRRRAQDLGLPCAVPESARDRGFLDTLRGLAPDLCVVADYGEILRPPFLEIPSVGAYNLHASLLPRHRGAAPVPYAILAGDRVTGVTLFRITRGLDSGPVVDRRELAIGDEESAGELEARLADLAARLLEERLDDFAQGDFTETEQEAAGATLAPRLEKGMGRIDWDVDPDTLCRRVRAFSPWPTAYTWRLEAPGGAERTVILRARPGAACDTARPGTVVRVEKGAFHVACRGGSVVVLEVQPAGKSAMTSEAYLRGRPLEPGERFGDPSG